jgi:hypothetical protein
MSGFVKISAAKPLQFGSEAAQQGVSAVEAKSVIVAQRRLTRVLAPASILICMASSQFFRSS